MIDHHEVKGMPDELLALLVVGPLHVEDVLGSLMAMLESHLTGLHHSHHGLEGHTNGFDVGTNPEVGLWQGKD